MPDNTQVYTEIPKREDTKVIVSLDTYKEHTFISIREWWRPDESQEFRPTQKGVTIPVADSEAVTSLIGGLQQVKADLFGEGE